MADTRTLNHSRSNKENPFPALIQIVIVWLAQCEERHRRESR
jgi:hypothetical protein